jgi:signal transduction histidine kinase
VVGDPAQLSEAVVQLVRNAQRATHERAGTSVQVTLTANADAWQVRVIDQGAGKTPALTAALAVPFGAAAADRVGIGLTLARWVARTHGGHLTLEDASTGGLEACLSLSRKGAPWSEPRS